MEFLFIEMDFGLLHINWSWHGEYAWNGKALSLVYGGFEAKYLFFLVIS